MREIKFRQRLTNSTWHYWGFIDGHFADPVLNSETYEDAIKHSQQYTNCKDKNKKEICVGDIVSYEDTESEHVDVGVGGSGVKVAEMNVNSFFPVKFIEGEFGIRITKNSEMLQFGQWYSLANLMFNEGIELEIIGNIYENKNLLK